MNMIEEIIKLSRETQELNRFIKDNFDTDNYKLRDRVLAANAKVGANIARMKALAEAQRAIVLASVESKVN